MRNVTKIGELLDQEKKSAAWSDTFEVASEIILNTDGGHMQHDETGKRSFEELISTEYRPEDGEFPVTVRNPNYTLTHRYRKDSI